ncbi:MAG: hypothetical protein U0835_05555 [Isosphaeraceae bacterium]
MPRIRVSIAGLCLLVALAALWFATIRVSTTWIVTLSTVLTLAALLSGVLGWGFLRGADRGFASGFALFGLVFLMLVNWDWLGAQVGRDLTSGLSNSAEALFPPEALTLAQGTTASNYADPGFIERSRDRVTRLGNFVQVGRLVFCMLFASAGGALGHMIAEKSLEKDPEKSPA